MKQELDSLTKEFVKMEQTNEFLTYQLNWKVDAEKEKSELKEKFDSLTEDFVYMKQELDSLTKEFVKMEQTNEFLTYQLNWKENVEKEKGELKEENRSLIKQLEATKQSEVQKKFSDAVEKNDIEIVRFL